MVVVSAATDERSWARRNEYWKIYNYDSCTKQELRDVYRNHGHSARSSWPKWGLKHAVLRVALGLVRYEDCRASELRSFCRQRKLAVRHLSRVHKERLMDILEAADEKSRFDRLLDLPPELRVLIYRFYCDSLPTVREPVQPPLSKVSRLIRQESLPIFFSTCTFTISIRATNGEFFDALNNRHLRAIRNVVVEGWEEKVVWEKGQATPKVVPWDADPFDELSQRGRNVVQYLETIEARAEGNNLLKAGIRKLRKLMTWL